MQPVQDRYIQCINVLLSILGDFCKIVYRMGCKINFLHNYATFFGGEKSCNTDPSGAQASGFRLFAWVP
ncbi:hypothetical protein CLDAP_23710 [Caldilinea aerophila DSM 14535 = NBRC 104270]|jgi:hypothetical protein|uniref:Uncharacterized protein n=1 Tax=Caldilinea aerophila (strain DSM 14535 / JCM 11387 / NBRC 104270 / STL-6-O1) TaxID=926550 RepID=I0I573_CALAS|nr:hypothetical protein CLDAP_23710 [Caldilinea aerophila DSM 14535 = NBRC 104270]